jgi:hypothetical protein
MRTITTLILLVAGTAAHAATLRVIPTHDGRAVHDARVCIFAGRQGDNFFDRFLASGAVACYDASTPIRLEPGVWSYFVQADGLTSADALGIDVRASEQTRPMHVNLVRAGTLDVSAAQRVLRSGEYLAVYVSNEGRRAQPNLRPIPAKATGALIPAGTPIMLLVVHDEEVVWASRPLRAEPDQTLSAPVPGPTQDVLAFLTLDPSLTPEELEAMSGSAPPAVRLEDARRSILPVQPPAPAPFFGTSIILFPDVPPGTYTVRASGAYWQADGQPVTVKRGAHAIAQPTHPVLVLPRGALHVTWHVSPGVRRTAVATSCTDSVMATVLRVQRCIFGFARSTARDCPTVHEELLAADDGDRELPQLLPGDYQVTVAHGPIEQTERATVRRVHTTDVRATLTPGRISGRATQSEQPLDGLITFSTGTARTSARTGEYDALITDDPLRHPISVTDCTTGAESIDLPSHDLHAGDTYDISIPTNELTIHVTDARTSAPVANAAVTSRIITGDHTISSRPLPPTTSDGTTHEAGISPRATLEVCVRHDQYEPRCTTGITMQRDNEHVTIAVVPSMMKRVRLLASHPTGVGRVFTAVGTHLLTETSIAADGTFGLDPGTPPTAVLYVVSEQYPLLRLAAPNLALEQPTLALPDHTAVTLTIVLPADSPHHGGPLDLAVSDAPVPRHVLQYLQLLHNHPSPQIRTGETTTIGPLDSTLPWTVLLWRWMDDLPDDLRIPTPFEDPRTLRLMYRAPAAGPTVVLQPSR